MLRLFAAAIVPFMFAAHATWAEVIPFDLQAFAQSHGNVKSMMLTVDQNKGAENMNWQLNELQEDLFAGKLLNISTTFPQRNSNSLNPKQPDNAYRGAVVHITTYQGDSYPPIRVYRETVYAGDQVIGYDPNRDLEYWLFGTGYIVAHQLKALEVLPVYSYSQCVSLGFQVVETAPRQCITPADDLFLDVPERPTQDELAINNFEDCLEKGRALIKTFPRRCVASGGRIFTEDPQLPSLADSAPTDEQPAQASTASQPQQQGLNAGELAEAQTVRQQLMDAGVDVPSQEFFETLPPETQQEVLEQMRQRQQLITDPDTLSRVTPAPQPLPGPELTPTTPAEPVEKPETTTQPDMPSVPGEAVPQTDNGVWVEKEDVDRFKNTPPAAANNSDIPVPDSATPDGYDPHTQRYVD